MSSYYANTELQAWQTQQSNYQNAVVAYNEQVAAIDVWNAAAQIDDERSRAAWEIEHDAWLADPGDPPQPAPLEPPPMQPQAYPPPPTSPDPLTVTVYDARDVTEAETLPTPTGDALIVPPRVVLTGNGSSFALSTEELAAGYTSTAARQLA